MSNTTKPKAEPEREPEIDSTAVRVYEHVDTATEFPVLKAFQEYLEAEQAKAHKRMLSLSIFFVVLLVIVVLTFTIITSSVINRNQLLSDRLMDIVLRERSGNQQQAQAPIVNVQQPAAAPSDSSASVKPILDKLEQLQSELGKARADAEAQKKSADEARRHIPAAPASAVRSADKSSNAALEQGFSQLDAIHHQQQALKAAREQLKAEQEAFRKELVEQQRRRLYPEYYAQEDARRAAEEAAKNPPSALPKPSAQPKADPLPPPQLPTRPQQTPPSPVSAQSAQNKSVPLLPALPNEKAQGVTNPPPAKPALKQNSALQALLDVDDAPKAAPKTQTLTAEEAKKVEAELKNLMEQADLLEEEAKGINKNTRPKGARKAPLPESSPKPEQVKGTESLEVGGKNGKAIPWLVAIPGETSVPEKEEVDEKKPAPQQPNKK